MDEILQTIARQPEPWTSGQIVMNCTVAFLLGLFVAWIYRETHRRQTVGFSFVNTLVLLAMLMTLVMMVIGSNIARAFGLAGAMSIIRFRTVVKDTRDTAFVFYSLGAGMAAGTGNLRIAVIGTLLIGLFIGILHWTRHGALGRNEFVVSFSLLPDDAPEGDEIYRPILERFCRSYQLVQVKSERMGETIRLIYQLTLRDPGATRALVNELSGLEGLFKVSLNVGESVET
ncbi:MAG: DUF4956 domain-containing protein [bacterium]